MVHANSSVRRRMGSYMYLSSDSLLTRMSRIRSILNNSPSMSAMVMEESAIEIMSSSVPVEKHRVGGG